MEEQLISFETAKLAKEKKFDWNCFYYYDVPKHDDTRPVMHKEYNNGKGYDSYFRDRNEFKRPTQSLLQKWLRENHHIIVYIQTESINTLHQYIIKWYDLAHKEQYGKGSYQYEQELEEGLKEALKLINVNEN